MKDLNFYNYSLLENEVKSSQTKSNVSGRISFGKKSSHTNYHGVDGNPLSNDIIADITQFQVNI